MSCHNECLTPFWNTSTHDNVINNICKNLGYKRISLSVDPIYSWREMLVALMILLMNIPKIIFMSLNDDIRDLSIYGVNIGRCVNEESIAGSKNAVFCFNVLGYKKILRAILYYLQIKNRIKKNKIGLVLGGDEAYIEFSIAAQLAIKNNIPAFFLKGGDRVKVCIYNADYKNAHPIYEKYPDILSELENNKDIMKKAEKILEKRVNGDRSSLRYMPNYTASKENQNSYLSAVWIFLHDFFDSPGIYGGNVFQSHCHWLDYTVKALRRYNVNVVIKRHPNERPENIRIIEKYKKKYKNSVVWCEEDMAISRIKILKCKAIITVYGTVITEATYLGIPVVAAGRSPYSGFNVCYQPNSIKQYGQYLYQMCIGDGLKAKSKDAAISAECANRFLGDSEYILDVPYDDMGREVWESCGLGAYLCHNYERRKVFLKNNNVYNYMNFYLQDIDVASKLGIKKYSRFEYWDNKE